MNQNKLIANQNTLIAKPTNEQIESTHGNTNTSEACNVIFFFFTQIVEALTETKCSTQLDISKYCQQKLKNRVSVW